MNLEQYEAKRTHKICVFGRAKVGKTALVAQLARIGKLWWFDLEDGIKTVLNPTILPREYWKNIEVFRIPSMQAIPMGIETLLKVIKGNECKICWAHGKVSCPTCMKDPAAIINRICLQEFTQNDWLVIDSITQLSSDANASVLKFIFASADSPEKFVLDKDTGGKDFKYPMAVSFMLDRIFSTVQAGNFNCAVISHEVMTEKLKDTGHLPGKGENQPVLREEEMVFPAAGSRNFSRNFGRYFDMLIHMDIVNKKHRAYSSTIYDPMVQTGSRLDKNIEEIKDDKDNSLPPFDAIVKLFEVQNAQTTKSA
jgi:hypothetical protein